MYVNVSPCVVCVCGHPHPIPDACLLAFADPFLLPKVGIDRGAIRFLLAGAPMMCPGLTSKVSMHPNWGSTTPSRPAPNCVCACARVGVHPALERTKNRNKKRDGREKETKKQNLNVSTTNSPSHELELTQPKPTFRKKKLININYTPIKNHNTQHNKAHSI